MRRKIVIINFSLFIFFINPTTIIFSEESIKNEYTDCDYSNNIPKISIFLRYPTFKDGTVVNFTLINNYDTAPDSSINNNKVSFVNAFINKIDMKIFSCKKLTLYTYNANGNKNILDPGDVFISKQLNNNTLRFNKKNINKTDFDVANKISKNYVAKNNLIMLLIIDLKSNSINNTDKDKIMDNVNMIHIFTSGSYMRTNSFEQFIKNIYSIINIDYENNFSKFMLYIARNLNGNAFIFIDFINEKKYTKNNNGIGRKIYKYVKTYITNFEFVKFDPENGNSFILKPDCICKEMNSDEKTDCKFIESTSGMKIITKYIGYLGVLKNNIDIAKAINYFEYSGKIVIIREEKVDTNNEELFIFDSEDIINSIYTITELNNNFIMQSSVKFKTEN